MERTNFRELAGPRPRFWVCSVPLPRRTPAERMEIALRLASAKGRTALDGLVHVHPETAEETPERAIPEGLILVPDGVRQRYDYAFLQGVG